MKLKAICAFLLLTIILSSCDANRVYDKYKEIPKYIWNYEQPVVFDVNIEDTIEFHNMYLNVRHASNYMFKNLYVFISITYPDNKISIDTVECVLGDDKGKWLGEGLGGIWDNKILIKKAFKFPQTGNYKFELKHGMRIDNLPFVMDIGMRIEKYKTSK